MSSIETYVEGEKLLCFHGPLIYEAKCLHVSGEEEDVRYLVHYLGWNKKWDEWVPESRMLKYTEKNLKLMKQLQEQYLPKAKKNAKSPAKQSNDAIATPSRKSSRFIAAPTKKLPGSIEVPAKKRASKIIVATPSTSKWRVARSKGAVKKMTKKIARTKSSTSKSRQNPYKATDGNTPNRDSTGVLEPRQQATVVVPRPAQCMEIATHNNSPRLVDPVWIPKNTEYEIKIPSELRRWLVNDWYEIEHRSKLLVLPASVTVYELMVFYFVSETAENVYNESWLRYLLMSIELSFILLLGSRLLYKLERPQFMSLVLNHPDMTISEIYGPIHLLRMCINIRELLPATHFSDCHRKCIKRCLQELVDYMKANSTVLFANQLYMPTTPEYRRHVS